MIERWLLPDGSVVRGDLPIDVMGPYGAELRKYVLYQFHHNRVTEPLLLEELRELGVLISSGQLHKMLVAGHELFHQEKQDILAAALSTSPYVQAGDTGSRHDGQNGFTTVVCNHLFTVFASTQNKSRVSFLETLLGGRTCYRIGIESLEYLKRYNLPPFLIKKLKIGSSFSTPEFWAEYLNQLGIKSPLHVRLVTEAALLGALQERGIHPALIILSDDAGQFNILKHALCWIHAERQIKKLEPINEIFARELEQVRGEFWDLYEKLVAFKQNPTSEHARAIEATFDELFQRDYQFTSLKLAMHRLYKNKTELLIVLLEPQVPLHNNQSESDIREKVVRRKISVTFNDESLRCRDSFASLKKTCRKLGITFWAYLGDRLGAQPQILNLGTLIRMKAAAIPSG